MDSIFGGASIEKNLFDHIRHVLPDGKTILELGSGLVTNELSKYYKMYSVEHDKKWIGRYNSNYIYAPIKQYKQIDGYEENTWFDSEIIKKEIPKIDYDLLLVDGPPYKRAGLIKYLSFFSFLDVPMFFDDVDRASDRDILIHIAFKLKKPFIVYGPGKSDKLYGVLNDPRLK